MCLIQCIQPYHLASRRAARHFETKSLQEILFSGRANLSKWKLNILFVPGIGRNILRLGGEKYFDISKYFSPPSLKIFLPIPGTNKIFNFHLLKFARPENKISWSDFVSKCLAALRDAKW